MARHRDANHDYSTVTIFAQNPFSNANFNLYARGDNKWKLQLANITDAAGAAKLCNHQTVCRSC